MQSNSWVFLIIRRKFLLRLRQLFFKHWQVIAAQSNDEKPEAETVSPLTDRPIFSLPHKSCDEVSCGAPMNDVTQILQAAGRGDRRAVEDLLPLVYDELRSLAAARMRSQMNSHTLQPTALVHEVWLRLVKNEERTWENRAHFFHAAAEAMRHILIEHARKKSALKHGGGQQRLDIADLECAAPALDERILLIEEGLEKLAREHPERAKVVVMKFFGGMTNEEVAAALGMGTRTVHRHWVFAKLWLFDKLRGKE
jgi:RNA polymerase sigma factor (TIGR02999 family)